MTATLTVRANHRAVSVTQSRSAGQTSERLEPHTSRDYTICDDLTVSVAEIADTGCGDRPLDAQPAAPE